MKVVKKILLVILVLIAIPFILALFVRKEYVVERETIINKPAQEVFDYVKFLKNQESYHYWVMMDPAMEKNYNGTDGTVGFIYTWNSKEAGKGEQEIKSISEGKAIDMEIRFIEPFEGTAYTHLTTVPVSDSQTKVTWEMNGKNNYPMNFMNLFMNKTIGEPINTSLKNLKSILENTP